MNKNRFNDYLAPQNRRTIGKLFIRIIIYKRYIYTYVNK